MRAPRLHTPETLEEALELLEAHAEDVHILAGGTALMIMLRSGLVQPKELVWVGRVPNLRGVTLVEGTLRIGARVTLRDVERSSDIASAVSIVPATASLVANTRVRAAATIGGNISESDYASDLPCVFQALDARVVLQSKTGSRTLPVTEFLVDYFQTALQPDELVTGVEVPVNSGDCCFSYLKFQTRSVEDRPCVGVCAVGVRGERGRWKDVRISVGATTPTPYRVPEAEALAAGSCPDEELFSEIARMYARACEPISDIRGSSEYRGQMIGVLVERALKSLDTERCMAVKV